MIGIGGEAVRIGKALGYELEKIGKLDPATLAKAGDGDTAAREEIDAILVQESAGGARGELQRPSMGQDMIKGRRTEIEFINGHIVDKGATCASSSITSASCGPRSTTRHLPIWAGVSSRRAPLRAVTGIDPRAPCFRRNECRSPCRAPSVVRSEA
jgi:hypothetical protein